MQNKVRKYYNEHVEEEDRRLDNHPFEIPVLMHFVSRYLKKGDHLFDVACGTGKIAGVLLEKGFIIGLNDLSDRNIGLVRKRIGSNPNVLFIQRSDVHDLKTWKDGKWKAIFMLGPMYHVISKEKRLRILELAFEHLEPGGYLFSAFMTRVGALVYGLKNNPEGILYPDGVEKLWNKGTDNCFIEATEWFTHAYFSHPEEVNELIGTVGFQALHLAGVEGIFGERIELYHQLDESLKKRWMDFIITYCEDPRIVHNAKHLLSVSKKPG